MIANKQIDHTKHPDGHAFLFVFYQHETNIIFLYSLTIVPRDLPSIIEFVSRS